LLAGRILLPSDTTKELLINSTCLHLLGFKHPSDALGKILHWNDKNTPIVGVIQDFHAHPLNMEVKPMAFSFDRSDCKKLIVALHPKTGEGNEWKKTIASIETLYKKTYPEEDFSYAFLDESIKNFYQGEKNISSLLKWATGLTVFISCLGMLGLVIYTTHQRTREIGVRKVLGASVGQIVSILSADFLKLVCLGFILATPAAWWAVHNWLQGFAFRTTISWWVFVLSGLVMLVIAFITLSIQIIRSAMANPVESLRVE
jgi:ABC-type antimicrobial peptide transport system permease subunit